MLVTNSESINRYVADGVVKIFPLTFQFLDNNHVAVYRYENDALVKVDKSEYSIHGAGSELGGHCEFNVVPLAGVVLAFIRDVPITQLTQYSELDNFPAESHENALSKLTMICQMLAESLTRAVTVSPTSTETPEDLVTRIFDARDRSEVAATASEVSKVESTNQAVNSAASAAQSASSATLAERWASAPHGEVVANDEHSAKHYAEESSNSATSAAADAIAAVQPEIARATAEADRAKLEADRAQSLADIGPAAISKLGFVKIGEGVAVTDDGTISVTPVSLATSNSPGLVMPGAGLLVDAEGALTTSPWDVFPPYVPIPVWGVTFGGSDGRRAIMPGESTVRENWIRCDGGTNGIGGFVPNITENFILGSSVDIPEGTFGGSTLHTHEVTGSTAGSTIAVSQMPSHNHFYYYPAYYGQEIQASGGNSGRLYNNLTGGGTGAQGGNASHAHTLNVTTSTRQLRPPYISMNFVIKVA